VRRFGIEISAGHIGLNLVTVNSFRAVGVTDWIKHRQQLARLVAIALHDERQRNPNRAVCILAAVLADAGRIALDIAWVVRGIVEGRSE
jgi:hypothetical protein